MGASNQLTLTSQPELICVVQHFRHLSHDRNSFFPKHWLLLMTLTSQQTDKSVNSAFVGSRADNLRGRYMWIELLSSLIFWLSVMTTKMWRICIFFRHKCGKSQNTVGHHCIDYKILRRVRNSYPNCTSSLQKYLSRLEKRIFLALLKIVEALNLMRIC